MTKNEKMLQNFFMKKVIKNEIKVIERIGENIEFIGGYSGVSGTIEPKLINSVRLLAIKNKNKKVTKREFEFLRDLTPYFTQHSCVSNMMGVEIHCQDGDCNIAANLQRKGFGISLTDNSLNNDSRFVLSEFGAMWILMNLPDYFNIGD